MKRLSDTLAPLYLGFALSAFANVSYNQWQFWAISVPFFIIVKLTKFNQNEE